jgi:hypothetical protein
MKKTFRWNPFADQPHNVAPRSERFRHHLKHLPSYFRLAFSNFRKAAPIIRFYREHKKTMYGKPVPFEDPFALSFSSSLGKNEAILDCLEELGIQNSLLRIPSWERDKIDVYEKDVEFFTGRGQNLTIALLQQRNDVISPSNWSAFLEEVFSRFGKTCSYFELGHAWNRTKWGVWDYEEYLKLAETACSCAKKHGVHLIGPAVIDFEFHLYPPVIERIPFEKITSLLYVDRSGAPENRQFGWDLPKKVALLRAILDSCQSSKKDLWITEVNWSLEGTGKYSPAPGKPSVSEEKQADYLVRYYVWGLASGLIQRIYWWQLVAPGYGLIDNREKEWRKRPSFSAFKTMVRLLKDSVFEKRISDPRASIFMFKKNNEKFAVCWTNQEPFFHAFPEQINRVLDRDGKEILSEDSGIKLTSSPKYVFLI